MDTTPIPQTIMFGIGSEVFTRAAMTLVSLLATAAVKYLANIARDIGALKLQFAISGVKEAEQDSILKAHSEQIARHSEALRNLETNAHGAGKTG